MYLCREILCILKVQISLFISPGSRRIGGSLFIIYLQPFFLVIFAIHILNNLICLIMAYNSKLSTPQIEQALGAALLNEKNQYNITQDKGSNYPTLAEAIAAVSDDKYKVNGIVLTYNTGKEWVSMRYNGEDASGFSDEQNWSYETFKADDEDLEQTNGLMKFKDRKYDEANFSGKGYKILRKNIQEVSVPKFDLTISSGCTSDGNITITIGDSPVEVAVTTAAATAENVAALIGAAVPDVTVKGAVVTFKSNPVIDYSTTGVTGEVADNTYTENRNVLTQEMINEANTVYEIRYDFDLNGAEITVPEGCVLKFNGGYFLNGIMNCNGNIILSTEQCVNCYNYNIPNINYVDINWFKSPVNTYIDAINAAIEKAHIINKPIYIPKGEYQIFNIDIPYSNIEIYGDGPKDTILTNPTWGIWTFRSSSDNLHIHHLGCRAIKVNLDTVRVDSEEADNGSSFILAKGNHCTFNDIYAEEIQTIIWLGGDFISESKYYNKVYNIESKNTSFAVLANLQNYALIENILGNSKQMIGLNSDGSKRIGPPAHLLYFTGTGSPQINNKINNIICYPGYTDNGGEVWGCSYKSIKNCDISNIFDYAGGQIFQYLYENNVVSNVNIIGNEKVIYSILIDGYNSNADTKQMSIICRSINIKNGRFRINNINANITDLNIDNYNSKRSDPSICNITAKEDITAILNNVSIIGNGIMKYGIQTSGPVNGFCEISSLINCNSIDIVSDNYRVNVVDCDIKDNTNWTPTIINYPIKSKYLIANESTFRLTLYNNTRESSFNIECNDNFKCDNIYIIPYDVNYKVGQEINVIINNNSSNTVLFRYRDSSIISDNNRYIYPKHIYFTKLIMTPVGLKELQSMILGTDTNNWSNFGDSANRPTGCLIGTNYFDTSIKKTIWWNGTGWVNSEGYDVDITYSGTTENRPLGVDSGFQYFDTTLKKPIWKTEDGWVDCTGASV